MVLPQIGAHPARTFPFLSGFWPLSHFFPPHFTLPLPSPLLPSFPKIQSLSFISVILAAPAAASCPARGKALAFHPPLQLQLGSIFSNPDGSASVVGVLWT